MLSVGMSSPRRQGLTLETGPFVSRWLSGHGWTGRERLRHMLPSPRL